MIKVENIDVWGFEHAIRGMRNPMNSWAKSDSEPAFHALPNFSEDDPMSRKYYEWNDIYGLNIKIGPNDLDLMRRLYIGGTEHRKYLRQIFVSMDITAPLYWWKEFDTYKVGTVANSCSTMHKIHVKEFELDDFSHEHLFENSLDVLEAICDRLNVYRSMYLASKEKDIWWQLIQLLPSSYNQKRTVTFNYENAVSMIRQRSRHKLDEWVSFTEMLEQLPYLKDIIDGGEPLWMTNTQQ